MRKLKYLLLLSAALFLAAGCERTPTGEDQLTGYWRGFMQINNGTGTFSNIDRTPVPLYCKIEQTGNLFIGKYSHTFDAEEFKKKMPEYAHNLNGTIAGKDIMLCLKNDHDINAKLKYANGRISGIWVRVRKNGSGVAVTTFEGKIDLVRY
jgi:hypothetical protein